MNTSVAEMPTIKRTNHAPPDMIPPAEQPLQTHVTIFDTSDNRFVVAEIKPCFGFNRNYVRIVSRVTTQFNSSRENSCPELGNTILQCCELQDIPYDWA